MISLFENNVNRTRQELTDIKAIAPRGLNTIRFYEKTLTTTLNQYVQKTFRVTIADGEPLPALLIVWSTIGTVPIVAESQNAFQFTLISGTTRTFTIRATCTSMIDSLEEL